MQCKKCGNEFSSRIVIDQKVRNIQNRKYCLSCSPFGVHNTKKLDEIVSACVVCGKIKRDKEKGKKCWVCANASSRERKVAKIQSLTGKECWICGYNTFWGGLDFHHIYPETKLFSLTTRELQFGWDKIEAEIKKCALLCCRCHREVHGGLITFQTIEQIWKNKWDRSSTVRAANGRQTSS